MLTMHESALKQFEIFILMATFAALIPYLLTAISASLLIKQKKIMIISICISLYTITAIFSIGLDVLYYGLLFFMSGAIIYWLMRTKRFLALKSA